MLDANKNNMKKIWGVLEDIVNKSKARKIQSEFKLNDGNITSNKLVISEKFNEFFINIGPSLAEKIPKIARTPESYLGQRINDTIF